MEEASARQYLCYYQTPAGRSERSNILELIVTGVYNNKPTLTALSSPMVTSGGNVTLLCVAQRYDKLILITEDQKFSISLDSQKINIGKVQAQFSLGPVNPSNRGVFRCHGSYKGNPWVWSEPSDSLEIHVSGMSRKPSLLTPKDPILAPGENLTLKCSSDSGHDRFALSKKGRIDLFQKPGHYLRAEISHASFPLGPVSSSHAGQYRCYGAHNFSSEWSAPSDPLDILIKESSTLPSSSWTSGSIPTIGLERYQKVLIGVSVAFFLMLFLLLLLLQCRCQGKLRMKVQREMDLQHPGGLQRWYSETKALRKDASLKDTQLEDSMELDIQSPPDEDVHGVIYAQVKSSTRRAEASLPSPEFEDFLERQAGKDREMYNQVGPRFPTSSI
ncbi:neutrophil immunoglobulin-like receptor 1 [Nannospalax galili]|uniref:neutrophil immunoglobulin-like receptor 1 n=1 Tax=Nannospalax galili TaxID=1026970 RepID=UPI00111BE9DC|nr:neutrophil immunoglobulin-like receptor 1 [Nannospalax galili]